MRKNWLPLIGGASALALMGWSSQASETTTYTYDALGRLTGSTIAGGPNASRATATCFDSAGNRIRYDIATAAPAACPVVPPTPLLNADPNKFNQQHLVPYSNGSSDLYQMDEPDE